VNEKKRYYCVTPSPVAGFDSHTIPADKNDWGDALELVESVLDGLYNDGEWTDIKATIECVELTDAEFQVLVDAGRE